MTISFHSARVRLCEGLTLSLYLVFILALALSLSATLSLQDAACSPIWHCRLQATVREM